MVVGPPADDALNALNLPDGYTELALKMAPAVRDLIVYNRDPLTVPVNELLAALGMPPVEPRAAPPSYPGLRSLALLNMLPKPTGTAADVIHEPNGLPAAACARLREAVDSASFAAADSVDGCIDYQLNLSRVELEELIGADEVRRVWAMATQALRKLLPAEYGGDDDEGAEALLDAHEIFVRVYTPHTRPWFPFHKDRSELTVNIALSDDGNHKGGRLIAIYDGAVRAIERREGTATLHPSSLMHAVSRMTEGTRHALIIFFGKNKKIVAFNREVKRLLKEKEPEPAVCELIAASEDGSYEEVKRCIERGDDIEARAGNGFTALHWAAWQGHTQVARLLLEHGADVEARNNDGNTPLMRAAMNGRLEVLRLLLAFGASTTATNDSRESALACAESCDEQEAAAVLRAWSPQTAAEAKAKCEAQPERAAEKVPKPPRWNL